MRGGEYEQGFLDGWMAYQYKLEREGLSAPYFKVGERERKFYGMHDYPVVPSRKPKKARKLSAWNKFVRANSKKKQFRYASGKVNLKKLGVAYRKKQRGKR